MVYWVDGLCVENDWLLCGFVDEGKFIKFNLEWCFGFYLVCLYFSDVVCIEGCMFIFFECEEDVGFMNNWVDFVEMYVKMDEIFEGLMCGCMMYVVLFLMGCVGGLFFYIGV